jgi:hypothetical protein
MHDAVLLDIGRLPHCGCLRSNPGVLAAWISTPTMPHVGDYTNIYPRRRSSACLHQLRPKRMPTALACLRHLHRPHADQDLHRQVHHHQAMLSRCDIQVYFDSMSTPCIDNVLALTIRSHPTNMSFSDEDNHLLPGTDEVKASHQVRHRQADTTRPGTDEAKATHLSRPTRPGIFIIRHRQARGTIALLGA